jgi:uncharacterized protein (TIRG00374 family)
MDQKLKKALSILVIVLSVAAVICIAFGNQELHDAWDAVRRLDLLYILGLLGCWAVYAGGDGVGIWFCLRRQGFLLSAGAIVRITLCGFFYSNITPGASGGQPMQVAAMNKAGVPVGNGTTTVTIRLICNQFMVSVLSLAFLIANREFIYRQLEGAIWFVRVGWVINFAVVPLVLLAAFRRAWIRKLVNGLISLLAKIRILKDPETTRRSADEVLDTYHTALNSLLRSPGEIIRQCLCSTASLLALTGSIVFVYHAFGMSGTPWYHLMSLAFLLFVSASYTPLPGASGAQEGGFLFYFRGIFTGGTIGLALLTWRFFTYYLFIFVGVINLLAEKISRRRQKR